MPPDSCQYPVYPLHDIGHAWDSDAVPKHLIAPCIPDLLPVMPVSGPVVRESLQAFTFQRRKAACPIPRFSQTVPARLAALHHSRRCHHMTVHCCQGIGKFPLAAQAMGPIVFPTMQYTLSSPAPFPFRLPPPLPALPVPPPA